MSDPSTYGLTLADGDHGDDAVTDPVAFARRERDWAQLSIDLRTSAEDACALLEDWSAADGERASACEGWTVRDVVAHVVGGEHMAVAGLRGELDGSDAVREWILSAEGGADGDLPTLVGAWRSGREALLAEMATVEGDARFERVGWVGPPISRVALAQSRMMETWIHVWDCLLEVDTLHVVDDRTWWVADLGVRTLGYGIGQAGLEVDLGLDLTLTGPGGGEWQRTFGPGSDAVRVEAPSWAWLGLAARRIAPTQALAAMTIEGSDTARAKLAEARAFV